MKTAIEKLRELREKDSSIVAIARDENSEIFSYREIIPMISTPVWTNGYGIAEHLFDTFFDSDNWQECIVTYKDLEGYQVEPFPISKSEYDRLLSCESKLNEIMKILEK